MLAVYIYNMYVHIYIYVLAVFIARFPGPGILQVVV